MRVFFPRQRGIHPPIFLVYKSWFSDCFESPVWTNNLLSRKENFVETEHRSHQITSQISLGHPKEFWIKYIFLEICFLYSYTESWHKIWGVGMAHIQWCSKIITGSVPEFTGPSTYWRLSRQESGKMLFFKPILMNRDSRVARDFMTNP